MSAKRKRVEDTERLLYFGVYPHGMREVVWYELQHCCKATIIQDYPHLNAVLFGWYDKEQHKPVGCYYTLFIYTAMHDLSGPTIEDVQKALTGMVNESILSGYRSWRVTGYRLGDEGTIHEFNTMDLEKATADAIGSNLPVDLSGEAEVEVVVWVMGLTIVVGWRPKDGWGAIDASRGRYLI